jgi:predicted Zn-dependent peptidase
MLAAPRAAQAASPSPGQIAFTQYTLANGLRVILAPDTRREAPPVIAVNVTYDVGSRNEVVGRSGFAHLFEHMMFQGSENVAKTEHIRLIESNGGSMNGTTNQDRTNFFETLPANQLPLALYLEADRMRTLDVSQENLDNQRQVVEEEKRQSYDNRPYGHTYEALLDLAYSSFPYKHTTIGSMADIDAATLADVQGFHKTYYEPNNAVLTVAGRFDPAATRALIEKDFGPITAGATPPPVKFDEPATPPGERRKTLPDPLARHIEYSSAYVTVPGTDPDYYPLAILADILAGGRTSRLYKALVEKEIATGVDAGMDENRGPALFGVSADLPAGGDTGKVEAAIDAVIQGVQQDGVTQDEMAIALAAERIDHLRSLQSAMGRATRLSLYAALFHDPERINTFLAKLQAVTPADVQRVAKKYLVVANRSVVITEPAAAPAGEGKTQ